MYCDVCSDDDYCDGILQWCNKYCDDDVIKTAILVLWKVLTAVDYVALKSILPFATIAKVPFLNSVNWLAVNNLVNAYFSNTS